jgi:hypothetical protein
VAHYHEERNHQGLGNALIAPEPRPFAGTHVRCRERLGGLLPYYHCAAWDGNEFSDTTSSGGEPCFSLERVVTNRVRPPAECWMATSVGKATPDFTPYRPMSFGSSSLPKPVIGRTSGTYWRHAAATSRPNLPAFAGSVRTGPPALLRALT